ncbi:MAG: hypothetical protein DRJ38_10695 [Thermoprotei archaeon]|nr:MAG: hypothetical protein DRJ38_10695 [Thermoprotei archaeon]
MRKLNKNTVKPNVQVSVDFLPYLEIRLRYRFSSGIIVSKRVEIKEYREPQTTDVRVVEVVYGNRREYGFPKTTDGSS